VFLAGGIVWLLLSIGTRYREEETPARGTPKREQRAAKASSSKDETKPPPPPEAEAEERPSRVRRPAPDAVPDDSIPEFEPPPRSDG
jgi:hypothetical protein